MEQCTKQQQHVEPAASHGLGNAGHMAGNSRLSWHGRGDIGQHVGVASTLWRCSVALAQAPSRDAQLPGKSRQAGDGATGLPPVLMLKHGVAAQHDHGGGLGRVAPGKRADALRLDASDRRRPFGRAGPDVGSKWRKAERVALDELLILESLRQDHLRQGERKRGVAARLKQEHLVSVAGRFGAARIDLDHVGAAFARLHQARCEIRLAGQRGAPEHNRARVGRHVLFRIGLDRPSQPQTIPAHRPADDRADHC